MSMWHDTVATKVSLYRKYTSDMKEMNVYAWIPRKKSKWIRRCFLHCFFFCFNSSECEHFSCQLCVVGNECFMNVFFYYIEKAMKYFSNLLIVRSSCAKKIDISLISMRYCSRQIELTFFSRRTWKWLTTMKWMKKNQPKPIDERKKCKKNVQKKKKSTGNDFYL